jgi:mono/diheme cytochrome c family protein
MRIAASALTAAGIWLLPLGAVLPLYAENPQPPSVTATAQAPSSAPHRALLDRYCVTCHNDRLRTADLALDTLDLDHVGESPEVWEKVVRKLRAGVMPPVGRPRPDQPSYDGLATWLEAALDRAAAASPDPGRTEPFHRLNRAEYQNAIRDLLALDIDITERLPPDDASYGFDNIAGVLKMSPTLMDRYLSVSRHISRVAVGLPVSSQSVDTFSIRPDYPQDRRLEGLPFGTRGGTKIRYTVPVDATYLIQVRLSRRAGNGANEDVPRFDESHDLELSVDGTRVALFTLAGDPALPGERVDPNYGDRTRNDLDANWEVRLPLRAGPREIQAAFVARSAVVDDTQARLPFERPIHYSDERRQPYLGEVVIMGPFDATGPGDTPSRRRIFLCQPSGADAGHSPDDASCGRTILTALAHRAYRRPVSDADLEPLLAFYKEGHANGGFDEGIQGALEFLLISPDFLFRVERDPEAVPPKTAYRVSDLELATRLSFFLWSSIPDAELLDLAVQGDLSRPAVLEQQVRRMLADPRSSSLISNFASQWLFLRNLPALTPDPRLFPDFDEGLREAMRRETELFVESIIREDRNVTEFLTADYTFVNERLARHYGIPHVKGSHFRRMTVPGGTRGGLLGHASILTVTAYPHRTSPVLRGKWVLENILGTPPPPPPPDVPPLEDTSGATQALSMRERMAQHRSSPTCAACHAIMDPPGLSLEQFDAVGRWREVDASFAPIDATGALPDGTTFDGVAGLRQALLSRPEQFVSTLSEKMLIYALGRGVEYYDAPALRAILEDAARDDYRFSSLVLGIVNSTPFQMRRTQP